MKLDILAIAAHPDDVELAAGGTLRKAILAGKKVGILDLTQGEMGTRGTPEIRAEEAAAAAEILGLSMRDCVGLPDGFLENSKEQQMAIIPFIRKYQPTIVLTNALDDRHPDHGKGSKLVSDACFLAGLRALPTYDSDGNDQDAWRPDYVYHFIQDRYIQPDFIVDVTDVWDDKMKSILAYKSQFHADENSDEPDTPISTPDFVEFLDARGREFGRNIRTTYGEGFNVERPLGVRSLDDLI